MKSFCFTVDDNIRFFKEITKNGYNSIFEHPYLLLYKRLHEKFGLKVQLNLFYRCEDFSLSDFSEKFSDEWQQNSHWLKLSFHSDYEKSNPYINSDYNEVWGDIKKVNDEILRFASRENLARTTTVHCCRLTDGGLKAVKDSNISGLLGLWEKNSRISYNLDDQRIFENTVKTDLSFANIDIILNRFKAEDILAELEKLKSREFIKVMIHEQYFYSDSKLYQPDFEKKLTKTFEFLVNSNYKSVFFEEVI